MGMLYCATVELETNQDPFLYIQVYPIIPALYLRNRKNKKSSHLGTLQSVITGAEGSVLAYP